jgi:hypothetical protein
VTFDPTPPVPSVIDVRVAAGSDDAEELVTGSMYLTSSDLELVYDRGGDQKVGMRFTGVAIPQGATITKAYVQFQVDQTSSVATDLTIQGEATDNAATGAAVPWTPPAWSNRNEAGPDQRTSDVASVIQEIVNRGGWASGPMRAYPLPRRCCTWSSTIERPPEG